MFVTLLQAWAGLFSSVARIISTVAVSNTTSKSSTDLSALVYFLSAAVVTLICFVSFFVLKRLVSTQIVAYCILHVLLSFSPVEICQVSHAADECEEYTRKTAIKSVE